LPFFCLPFVLSTLGVAIKAQRVFPPQWKKFGHARSLRLGLSSDSPIARKNVLGAKKYFPLFPLSYTFCLLFPNKSQSCPDGPIAIKFTGYWAMETSGPPSTAPQTTKIRLGLSSDSPIAGKNV
jgi:hypothetical protein